MTELFTDFGSVKLDFAMADNFLSKSSPSARRRLFALTLVSTLCFAACTASAKAMGSRVPTLEKVFIRSILCAAISIASEGPGDVYRALKLQSATNIALLGLRGSLGFIALFCYFDAATVMPLVRLTLITRLHPAISSALAPKLLGEPVRSRAIVTLIIAGAGVVVVALEKAKTSDGAGAGAGTAAASAAAALVQRSDAIALCAAVFTSAAFLCIRTLTLRKVPPKLIVLGFHAGGIPWSLGAALIFAGGPGAVQYWVVSEIVVAAV